MSQKNKLPKRTHNHFLELELPFVAPYQVLALWPESIPLVAWLSHAKNKIILITSGCKMLFSDLAHVTWNEVNSRAEPSSQKPPFFSGAPIIGVASYDGLRQGSLSTDLNASIFYCGCAYLEWDLLENRCSYRVSETHVLSDYSLTVLDIKKIISQADNSAAEEGSTFPEWHLTPHASEKDYLEAIQCVKDDIRKGRYYQLNFLKFFSAIPTNRVKRKRKALAQKMSRINPPYGLWIEDDKNFIYSMSPERFVEVSPTLTDIYLSAYPIKGTLQRHIDPAQDNEFARQLIESKKDLSELHIIVDLLRNDMQPLCKKRSINVISSHHLQSSRHVHHLEAEISGILKLPCYFSELITKLCPSGSVTGAPKKEVMIAIEQYEQRPRNFFMGNGFYLSPHGDLHSSVLIRTLVNVRGSNDILEFAAGSGITVASDPRKEYQEILTKCRILLE